MKLLLLAFLLGAAVSAPSGDVDVKEEDAGEGLRAAATSPSPAVPQFVKDFQSFWKNLTGGLPNPLGQSGNGHPEQPKLIVQGSSALVIPLDRNLLNGITSLFGSGLPSLFPRN